ncbi:hypothetical protein RM704_00610 [Streptomyces sp. DSM 3412]|uniref:Uncharacterized protein n=1 Tax=Streptomyces gottesmaniae TaxID=3075518 RepID=A0ABU2YPU5_9ACTN|nr:hypothetical protein [Streptomyces sp. DSM 3412]MDT0565999.1 hypothetical protein [Streptomyces sp. DSM 3412]
MLALADVRPQRLARLDRSRQGKEFQHPGGPLAVVPVAPEEGDHGVQRETRLPHQARRIQRAVVHHGVPPPLPRHDLADRRGRLLRLAERTQRAQTAPALQQPFQRAR